MNNLKKVVDSSIGRWKLDGSGSPVSAIRINPEDAYSGIGKLLQEYINASSKDAWEKIRTRVDYIFSGLRILMDLLEKETGFGKELEARLQRGQKLLFKPNLVNLHCITPFTHAPGPGTKACTEWAFVAALIRWFHEELGISYYQMAIGEAATVMPAAAVQYSKYTGNGKPVTPEALIEGKSGDFYGGWGFYFARKYLAETSGSNSVDNPFNGYEESVSGTYIPVGLARDKLMVYDLNRILGDQPRGRDINVPGGINFNAVNLHKVLVGGDPESREDRRLNPGCVIVNVPRLKVHAMTLFTNAIKNIGIGLYPMQSAKDGSQIWDYAIPPDRIPAIKGALPHQVWHASMDSETGLPVTDGDREPIVRKTGGLTATMLDVIGALSAQKVFLIHVVDAIEPINIDHQGTELGERKKEGLAFAGLDVVATDLACARFMFSNMPMKTAVETGLDDGHGGNFVQRVPIPSAKDGQIVSDYGYDSPLSRDLLLQEAESRSLGQRQYYILGHDFVTDLPLVSLKGHIGTLSGNQFSDLYTETLYYDLFCTPWCLQKSCFSYLESVDRLTGSSLKDKFLAEFDENGTGIVTYEEFGKKGQQSILLYAGGHMILTSATEDFGYFKGMFQMFSRVLKQSSPQMNAEGTDYLAEQHYGSVFHTALQMSLMGVEFPDFFSSGLTWGNGKWPGFAMAQYAYIGTVLYGRGFPNKFDAFSMYGHAFTYADLSQNSGKYVGRVIGNPVPESIAGYMADVASGAAKPLDFLVYVPIGFDRTFSSSIPNVEATTEPGKVFTASFSGGKELWPNIKIHDQK